MTEFTTFGSDLRITQDVIIRNEQLVNNLTHMISRHEQQRGIQFSIKHVKGLYTLLLLNNEHLYTLYCVDCNSSDKPFVSVLSSSVVYNLLFKLGFVWLDKYKTWVKR